MWEYDGEGHEYDGEEVFREEEAHDVEFLLRWEAELRVLGLLRYPSGAWAADMWEARREEIQWQLHVLRDHGD